MTDFRLELHTGERDISGFDCGKQELTDWLLRHAMASHRADLARTYLALDGDIAAGKAGGCSWMWPARIGLSK